MGVPDPPRRAQRAAAFRGVSGGAGDRPQHPLRPAGADGRRWNPRADARSLRRTQGDLLADAERRGASSRFPGAAPVGRGMGLWEAAGRARRSQPRRDQGVRNRVEIRDDVLLDPGIERAVPVERQVEFLAVVRHQRQRQKSTAPAVIFRVEEVAHSAALARLDRLAIVGRQRLALAAALVGEANLPAALLVLLARLAPALLVTL